MGRNRAWGAYVLLSAVTASGSGCALIDHFSITMTTGTGGGMGTTVTTTAQTTTVTSTTTSVTASGSTASATTTSSQTSSSSSTGGCSCTGLVSAYHFADATNLGKDSVGTNDFTMVYGAPAQSSVTPNGLPGHSIDLNGSSSVCIPSGFTFDSASDHTVCWWSRPDALSDQTNQFAQFCAYDTWTQSAGVDYLWRINNCNSGTPADFVVPGVFAAGTWVEICQTYTQATMTRTVVINGDTSQTKAQVDTVPIVMPATNPWCIGSFGSGGYWTGLIYMPLWFNRVLSDTEIQNVYTNPCCLQ